MSYSIAGTSHTMISHRLLFSGFVALLVCCLPAAAQTSSAQASKTGTISGRVVNESGRPLHNVRVIIRRLGSIQVENTATTTDREGKFKMSGLEPVNYRVSAFLEGYAPVDRVLDDPRADIYRVGDSVTLTLTKGGVITGTVTSQTGEPVVGVNVRALMVRARSSLPFPYNVLGAADLTDDRGIYRIYGLAEGSYVVWAGGGGDRVRPNADAFNTDVPTYAPSSTRDSAREVPVRAGGESSGVDIQYRGGSGHAVSGQVTGVDRAGPFVINLIAAGGPAWETTVFQTPEDRGFMIQGLDDGDYYLVAMSSWPNGDFMLSDAKRVRIRGADVAGVQLVVQPLSSVNARVALEETKARQCTGNQRPVLTETLVSAESGGANVIQGSLRFLSNRSNADEQGNVALKNLPHGRYYFTTQYYASDWYVKSMVVNAGVKAVDAARTWTTLKPGELLNGLTITLAQGAASLRGQIALIEGEIIADRLYVYLVPAEKESAEDPLRFYGAAVAADGKVALDNLAPGRYLVFARVAADESPLIKLRSPDTAAYRARLRADAEAMKSEVDLKPCQKLSDLKVRARID